MEAHSSLFLGFEGLKIMPHPSRGGSDWWKWWERKLSPCWGLVILSQERLPSTLPGPDAGLGGVTRYLLKE